MITRIKIDGFKSLLNTELYLGPFTCIAGANAIGKSNFFDAILFLSHLANNTILQAAKSIRSENMKHSNLTDVFYKAGNLHYKKMMFEIDMIIPKTGIDDLGQSAKATITSLSYSLELKLNDESPDKELIEIIKEELRPITQSEAKKNIHFPHSKEWLDSVISGRRLTQNPFISTDNEKIKLHQDGGNKGRTAEFIAEKMPRTLLSTVTAESPTAFLVREEMRNWSMLQFEPSALRKPNSVYEVKNAEITANGSNMPATLYRLHHEKTMDVYQTITNKLKELVSDVNEITVDKDEKRDLLTLQVEFKDKLILPAQSLSDGSLRFLALAIINEDNKNNGLICLEEPENGINPKKITEMVELLEDMAMDTDYDIDEDNPMRQVIINSHSPLVVSSVNEDSLFLANYKELFSDEFKKKITYTGFSCLPQTWKSELIETTTLGEIIAYLDHTATEKTAFHRKKLYEAYDKTQKSTKKRTVAENINQLKLDL
ncbi:MAG: AAA family ATPase [Paludibacteraceae bacterium]|nr:AAA family ATPase [Paludibacteraceae bacterium]